MKHTIVILATALCIALVSSHPVREEERLQSKALDRLVMVEADNEAAALRSKRTIGILRQLFPGISQIVEQKVNSITAELFRVLGPVVLRNVLGNNRPASAGGSESTVTAKSPFDDDDDDEDENEFRSTSSNGSKVSISFPTFPPDEDEDTEAPKDAGTTSSPDTSVTGSAARSTALDAELTNDVSGAAGTIDARLGEEGSSSGDETTVSTSTTTVATTTSRGSGTDGSTETAGAATTDVNPEAEDRANEVAAESQNNEVRVQFADEQSNDAQPELTPLDEIETNDDENRNKRFLNFGFGGAAGAGGAGSGAGSGNFLFDIIRQAADGAARAAGTVYRVVAGTQSLGLGLSATRDLGPAPQDAAPAAAPGDSSTQGASSTTATAASGTGNQPPLVAGSGSQQGNSSGSATAGKADTTQEAVPGPVTRLFVIANRGISNLVQDLILRLAATSERIVNFKARLITSII